MYLLKKQEENKKPETVCVIDDHLVLSLTETESPVIWRMALDDIGTATFSIKKGKDGSKLILKKKDNKEETIASFKKEEEANEILASISRQLLKPQKTGTYKNPSNTNAKQSGNDPKSETIKWGIALILVVVIITLYIYLTSLMPEQISNINQASPTNAAPSSQGDTGKPISADEFLKGL